MRNEVFRLDAPAYAYATFTPIMVGSGAAPADEVPLGSLLAIRTESGPSGIVRLGDLAAAVRRVVPWAPIVGWAGGEGELRVVPVGEPFRSIGVLAIVTGARPDPVGLRAALPDVRRSGPLVAEYLRRRIGARWTPRQSWRANRIVGACLEVDDVDALAHALIETRQNTWKHCRRLFGYSAGEFLGFIRCMAALVELQRDPGASVESAALGLGMDRSNFSRSVKTHFGRSVRELRRWIGIEPLIESYLRARGFAAASQPTGFSSADGQSA